MRQGRDRFFGGGVEFVPADFNSGDRQNWAGVLGTAPGTLRFTSISGQWVVSDVNAPEDGFSSLSQWVGIGGNENGAAGLFQAGSTSSIERITGFPFPTPAAHYVWYEWLPFGAMKQDLPVRTGDTVRVALAVSSPTSGTVSIVVTHADGSAPSVFNHDVSVDDTAANRVDGKFCEWVLERPAAPDGTLRVLPDFGTRVFGPGYNWVMLSDFSYQQMRDGSLLTMVDNFTDRKPLATPTMVAGTSQIPPFSVFTPGLPSSDDVLSIQWKAAK
jgi:hypothetical protein